MKESMSRGHSTFFEKSMCKRVYEKCTGKHRIPLLVWKGGCVRVGVGVGFERGGRGGGQFKRRGSAGRHAHMRAEEGGGG